MDDPLEPAVLAGDVMLSECRARTVLASLAEKWALLIIEALSGPPKRTSALRRQIGGVSEKMLIQTLRRLEALGLIERRDFREVPPKVEYALTERGRSLSPIVVMLDRWVETHAFDMLPKPAQPFASRTPDTATAEVLAQVKVQSAAARLERETISNSMGLLDRSADAKATRG